MVLGGFHVYKSIFFGWVFGQFNIAVNGEHNCGVLPNNGDPTRNYADKAHHDYRHFLETCLCYI